MKISLFWKRLIAAFLLFLIIIAGFAFYINQKWRPFVSRYIHAAIASSTDSLYSVSFNDISINILSGNVNISGINFKPDSEVYKKLVAKGIAPRHLYSVEIARLKLTQIHPLKVYFNRELEMNSLTIDKPVIKMIFQNVKGKQDTVMDKRTAYQRLSKYLRSIAVNQILLQDVDFKYIDKTAVNNQVTGLKDLNIQVDSLRIDSASQFDKKAFYYTRNISISLKNYALTTRDSLYDLTFKELTASTRGQYARITGLSYLPRYGEMPFSMKFKYRQERYSVSTDEILLEKINYRIFNSQRRLVASKLSLTNTNVSVFLNGVLPSIISNKTVNLPPFALKRLNLDTKIDTVSIKNASVRYSEFNPLSQRKGTIYFNAIDGQVTNFTNNGSSLQNNKICKVDLTCLLMGRGRFNLGFAFDLLSPQAEFDYSGSLGLMDAEKLNPVIKPLGLVEIRSGNISDMRFNGRGDVHGVKGNLAIKYDNLKINLLSKSEKSSRLKKMSIASMAANILIIKNDNPMPGEKLRRAGFNYQRPPSAGFFSTLWRSLFMGIKETIGLDAITQQKIERKIRQMNAEKTQREERKQERLKRKEVRKIRQDAALFSKKLKEQMG